MFDTGLDPRAVDDDAAITAGEDALHDTAVTAARAWLAERLLAEGIHRAHASARREFAVCSVQSALSCSDGWARTLISDAWTLRPLVLTRAALTLGLLTVGHARAAVAALGDCDDDLARTVEATVLGRWLGDAYRDRLHLLEPALADDVREALLATAPTPPTAAARRPAQAATVTPACPHEQQALDLALPTPRDPGQAATAAAPALDDPSVREERPVLEQRPVFCAGRTPADLTRALVRVRRRLDADDTARRRRAAERRRMLMIDDPEETGFPTLSFSATTPDALAIRDHAYAVARARHAAGLGSPDGLDATANDVVRDYLLALAHPDPLPELLRLRGGGLPDTLTTRRPVHVTVILPATSTPGSSPIGGRTGGPTSNPTGSLNGGPSPSSDSTHDRTPGDADGGTDGGTGPVDLTAVTAVLRNGTPLLPTDLVDLLRGATVRRATTDPTGRVIAVDDRPTVLPPDPTTTAKALTDALTRTLSRPRPTPPPPTTAHDPTAGIARVVDARWRHCTAPGCRRPTHQCDRDHRVAHQAGGPTCTCNLAPLCRTHHRAKQAGWTPTVNPDGSLTWTSPQGRATRHPPPWDDDHL